MRVFFCQKIKTQSFCLQKWQFSFHLITRLGHSGTIWQNHLWALSRQYKRHTHRAKRETERGREQSPQRGTKCELGNTRKESLAAPVHPLQHRPLLCVCVCALPVSAVSSSLCLWIERERESLLRVFLQPRATPSTLQMYWANNVLRKTPRGTEKCLYIFIFAI